MVAIEDVSCVFPIEETVLVKLFSFESFFDYLQVFVVLKEHDDTLSLELCDSPNYISNRSNMLFVLLVFEIEEQFCVFITIKQQHPTVFPWNDVLIFPR